MLEMIKFVQSFHNPFLDVFFQLVTMMGEDYFFILIMAAAYWCVDKEYGYRLGFAYLLTGALNSAVKEIFKVPRPIGEPGIRSLRVETATGYSFPSGHTQCSATLWTSLMLQLRKKWLFILGTFFILLVGLSRVYLGVHTPLDVLGGIVLGAGWAAVSNLVFDYINKPERKFLILIVCILVTACAFIFPTHDYCKAAGIVASFCAGWFIESSYIKFNEKAELWKQIIKFVTGVVVLLAIKVFIKPILPETPVSDYLRYFLMGIWVTVIGPLLFKSAFGEKTKIEANA